MSSVFSTRLLEKPGVSNVNTVNWLASWAATWSKEAQSPSPEGTKMTGGPSPRRSQYHPMSSVWCSNLSTGTSAHPRRVEADRVTHMLSGAGGVYRPHRRAGQVGEAAPPASSDTTSSRSTRDHQCALSAHVQYCKLLESLLNIPIVCDSCQRTMC